MGLVIAILIQREVAKTKESLIKDYEAKLEQVNRAQRDLSKRILDELIHIKTEHEH
jgi:hypothetical protein